MPGWLRPWTGDTPESIRAMSTPRPVKPAFHHVVAPEYAVVLYIEFMSAAGSYAVAAAAVPVMAGVSPAATTLIVAKQSDAQRRGASQVVPEVLFRLVACFTSMWTFPVSVQAEPIRRTRPTVIPLAVVVEGAI